MIKVYKTFEIDNELWEQIVDGFNESFEGHHTTVESIRRGFCIRNQWGYAYHSVAFDENTGEVMGFNTGTPTLYKNDMKVFVAGTSFVRAKYRKDIFILWDMLQAMKDKGLEDGFQVGLGVPNHNAIEYSTKLLGATLAGYLNYYVLPVKISRCVHKSWLSALNGLTRCLSNTYIALQCLLTKAINNKEKEFKYSLVTDDDFYKARFGDPCYIKYCENDFLAYFRVVDEDGAKAAYVMDFRENGKRTSRALAKAVRFIVKSEKPDAVLYVGILKLNQHILFKVPHRFIPKPLPMTFSIYRKSDKEKFKDMKDINNWDFSLMNFDVR